MLHMNTQKHGKIIHTTIYFVINNSNNFVFSHTAISKNICHVTGWKCIINVICFINICLEPHNILTEAEGIILIGKIVLIRIKLRLTQFDKPINYIFNRNQREKLKKSNI